LVSFSIYLSLSLSHAEAVPQLLRTKLIPEIEADDRMLFEQFSASIDPSLSLEARKELLRVLASIFLQKKKKREREN
jgi:hypothetical protein